MNEILSQQTGWIGSTECSICREIAQWEAGNNLFVIAEFKHSLFVVGDHQFFEGYSLLLCKGHVRDLHELAPALQEELFRELMIAAGALIRRYKPCKMNYASYGNVVPHVHWHLIPRYESDPDIRSQPWKHESEFSRYRTNAEEASVIAESIRRHL